MKKITINPVTRVEGHMRVEVFLDDDGSVKDAHVSTVEFRGYEKFCVGRRVEELPRITSTICGTCPVSHHLASAKAGDAVYGVEDEIPPTAYKLRELMHMGQIIHSHLIHFYVLAAPDLVLGPDYDPAKRNILGLVDAVGADFVKEVIRARATGQELVAATGAKRLHQSTAVPGGITAVLSEEKRRELLEKVKTNLLPFMEKSIQLAQELLFDKYADLVKTFGVVETSHMGLVNDGNLDLYHGVVRVMKPDGEIFEFEAKDYQNEIVEIVHSFSSMKSQYLKRMGSPEKGIYRVNALPRINVCDQISTERANELLKDFRKRFGRPAQETLLYHYCRLIEVMHAAEKAIEILEDKETITSTKNRVKLEKTPSEGVGVLEAPRGTLFHHYKTDENGIVKEANIIVATSQNQLAWNEGIRQVAKQFIKPGEEITQGVLNRIEMVIRAYDPCNSCATHTLPGKMPIELVVYDSEGKVVETVRRNI